MVWKRAWGRYRADNGTVYRVYVPDWVINPDYAPHVGGAAANMTEPRLPRNIKMRRQVWHRDSDGYRWSLPNYDRTIKFWPLPGGSQTLPNPDSTTTYSDWHIVAYRGERVDPY